ncbi:MAG TPA: hypothetical protein VIL74_00855 [Pyrinomonadaceae bacterium]|jgi:hypothetical protein
MQIEQNQNELIIRETPGCLWIFGLFFAIVGGVFVWGALGGFADWGTQSFWMLAAAFLMGAVGVAGGGWIIYGAPVTRVVVDRHERDVLMTRYGLFGKRETIFAFDEIEQFRLVEERDDESNPIWSLAMDLTNGETVKISSLPSHDRRFKENFVFRTNEFMHKQLASTELIFDAQDEDFPEIG